jgi:hypothetical protein|eukprot:COSAG01_NODE_4050_length_5401_cov_4.215956_2_plen_37_part_00
MDQWVKMLWILSALGFAISFVLFSLYLMYRMVGLGL